MGVNKKINSITNQEIVSEERIATLERVLTKSIALLLEAKNDIVMMRARLDLSKLPQLPETHILQSNLSLPQLSNTSPSHNNASQDIALLVREVIESEK